MVLESKEPRCQICCCPGLKVLRIQGGSFTSVPPTFFSSSVRLVHLDLSYNSIESLPAHLFNPLTSLNSLRLRANAISSLNPDLLSSMVNLTHLDISDNMISEVPSEMLKNNKRLFDDTSIVSLIDLSGNKLTQLPNEILTRKRSTSLSAENISKTLELVKSVSEMRVLKKTVLTLGVGGRQFKRVMDLYNPWLGHTLFDLSGNRIEGEVEVGPIDGWLLDLSR